MTTRRMICLVLFMALGSSIALLFGAEPVATDVQKPHAPLELFGVGPEMFQDRGSAWVEAIGTVAEKAIVKLGVIAVAILLAIQNVKQRTTIKDRLDRQREDINHVAAAAGVTPPSQVASPPVQPAGPQT